MIFNFLMEDCINFVIFNEKILSSKQWNIKSHLLKKKGSKLLEGLLKTFSQNYHISNDNGIYYSSGGPEYIIFNYFIC